MYIRDYIFNLAQARYNLEKEHHCFSISAMILLVVWSANGDGSALTYKASSKTKFNFLNDDTYRWNCATVICHPSDN